VGTSGVGKTVLIEKTILQGLGELELSFTINFSAGTTSKGCQEVIESNFDKRANNKFKPKNSNIKAICFIDDLNMPREDRYGSQPPLELLRQWIDHGFWYDRQKVVRNLMQDMQILAAMGKPGGGRRVISNRIVSKFHLITFTQLTEQNMRKIYDALATNKFSLFYEEIKTLIEPISQATINLFNIVQDEFLPTPTKPHYQFNMRDISKVFQGLYLADKFLYEQKEQVVKLWGHEVLRVFADRLINVEDQNKFKKLVND
jgi:dynein heavy chain